MQIDVLYFARLREVAGCESERVETDCADAAGLYRELQLRHGFEFPPERLRVAIGGEFVSWDARLEQGAEVVFIPPVSGG